MTFEEWIHYKQPYIPDLQDAFTAGIEEGKRQGLEKAAEIARQHQLEDTGHSYSVVIADAIRAEIKE